MSKCCGWLSCCLLLLVMMQGTDAARRRSRKGRLQADGPTGQNTCPGPSRFKRRCCPGWSQPGSSRRCIVPICISGCGSGGRCMRPNVCLCANRQIGPSCSACTKPCLNGGRCTGKGQCSCPYGFTGGQCHLDYRTGPCFTQISNNMCRGQLTGVVCTKTLCCSTIGKAWGRPCEQCPASTHPCRRGYIPNPKGDTCIDVDECQAIPGLCVGGNCVNTLGSYRCECREGQTQNPITKVCEDINECETIRGICDNGQCTNTEGSYFCTCNRGFEPTNNRSSCVGVEQGYCFTSVINLNCQERISEKTSFQDCCCMLGKGWGIGEQYCQPCPLRNTDSYDRLCRRNQPITGTFCSRFPKLCANGRCVDVASSFRCDCNEGFKEVNNNCVDIDECEQQGLCRNGRCKNTEGSYTCDCNKGFVISSSGKYCTDMNECAEEGMCPNGVCYNMDGSYKCRCNVGFKQSPNQQVCYDINECTENGRLCINGRCVNTDGSYRCECNNGYQLSPDGAFCLDYNECQTTGMCTNGNCINMDGSYKCVCNPGYILGPSGQVCIDVNECSFGPDQCINGQCINNQGSFRCECLKGFTLGEDRRTCRDTRRSMCYPEVRSGRCVNPFSMLVTKSECCCGLAGSKAWGQRCERCPTMMERDFINLCKHGKGRDHDGKDINECALKPDMCENGACENLDGGYQCVCNEGYTTDPAGRSCLDINECAINMMLCDGGQCRNTPGSYRCICPDGYRFNHATRMCEDQNECDTSPCIGGRCINTAGSFRCECTRPGTMLDSTKRICLDNRRGACWLKYNRGVCENNINSMMLKSECCGTVGKAWGSPCEQCPPDRNLQCPKGYAFTNGINCVDVNECEVIPNLCRGGGQCVNTEGSFRCTCPAGLELDSSGRRCIDTRKDECFLDYNRGFCTRQMMGLFNKHMCCCTMGKAWGRSCEPCPIKNTDEYDELCNGGPGMYPDDKHKDINECFMFPGMCVNGECRNVMGSFSCTCNPGYAKDDTGFNCTDINECLISSVDICGTGECINMPGTFRCQCDTGFRGVMMDQMCVDIDECSENPGLCLGGSCRNVPGSYECDCPDGHEVGPDGSTCKDVDECSSASSICSNGHCENYMGGYQCICTDGYTTNNLKTTCIDVDECGRLNGGCMGRCVNTPGSFSCGCESGYLLMLDGKTCIDVDECKENPDICRGGRCFNQPGDYRCTCTGGTTPAPDQKSCIDVDECQLNKNLCMTGVCQNTHGSFSCKCDIGFSVKSETGNPGCTDDDECLQGSSCDSNAVCINTLGSFKCDCKPGFTGDGFTCRDANECIRDNGGCDRDASCINTPGSFRCICDEGFTGDGFQCRDVDECTVDPNLCDNGQCYNYPGGFRCECDMGFAPTEDERACVDINECDMFHNLCVNGRCENVFGMFRCICNQGYQLDNSGGNCTDIDECQNIDNCQYGTCVNTQGGYLCQCPPQYELNPTGTGCVDKRLGACYMEIPRFSRRDRMVVCTDQIATDISRATCCCTVGKGWGDVPGLCEHCPRNGSSEYNSLCPGGPGFRPNTITLVVEDIDECAEIDDLCNGGRCQNTFGSYMCVCPEGYEMDETRHRCVDVDECRTGARKCGVGECVNTEGNYTCICPSGYEPMDGGRDCLDMRKGNCYMEYLNTTRPPYQVICEQPMSRQLTKRQCCCTIGAAWNGPCEPCPQPNTRAHQELCFESPMGGMEKINECRILPNVCQNGRCVDTPGSFRCQCYNGYTYDRTTHVCRDEDECRGTLSPCVGNSQCVNTDGSYECTCPDGYRLNSNRRSCDDINECVEEAGVCANGECQNLVGSFRCVCRDGFRLSSRRDSCADIDECASWPGRCRNGSCQNTIGSFRCVCSAGFELTESGDCFDVDECRSLMGICQNGRCQNTLGSFRCQCQTGYTDSSDRQNCRDIDECAEIRGTCRRGTCQNTEGSYLCQCLEGFTLSRRGDECIDINECRTVSDICYNGECRNTVGSFICTCPPGFQLSSDGLACRDMRSGFCFSQFVNGRCLTPKPQNLTKAECCCSMGAAWGSYSECEVCPRVGEAGYRFLCPEGQGYIMVMPEKIMTDMNECLKFPGVCVNGICVNTDGSFRCECKAGYTLDSTGQVCIDADECQDSLMCGNGTCTNTVGSFQCTCRQGFSPGPHETCEDVNECSSRMNTCAFRCLNVPGSFRCVCPMGYRVAEDGIHCEDVDECVTPANNCKYDCKNIIGSFLCVCPEGFKQVGVDQCRDIDECRTQRGLCLNGRCMNTQGGYRCRCNRGYQLSANGRACLDRRQDFCYPILTAGRCVRTATVSRTTKAQCCCALAAAWGSTCEKCPPVNTIQYKQLCPQGPGFTPDGKDIDECADMPDACANGRCLNTMGSYRCVCNKGYKTDASGKRCVDVDECALEPSPCDFTCQNTDGSFICTCPRGHVLNADGKTCRDLDECTMMQHNCRDGCINTPGSFECECPPGFRKGRTRQCDDIDECAETPSLCGPVGTCQNNQGSFRCVCPRGYKTSKDGTKCIDMNECEDGDCEGDCENLPGSYRCECPPGYSQHYTGQCYDENECMDQFLCGVAICINLPGSFDCQCNGGQTYDMQMSTCLDTSACGGNPCVFGCSPSSQGFSCGCPSGYQPIGQGHCISTINQPDGGSERVFPDGVQLPHEAGDGRLPKGEGCYDCDHDFGDLPLTKRNKRSLADFVDDEEDLDKLMKNTVKDMETVKTRQKREVYQQRKKGRHHKHRHAAYNSTSSTDEVRQSKTQPIVIYLKRKQTRPKARVIKVIPSMKALLDNIEYTIKSGNKEEIFSMHKRKGISSLHFVRKLHEKGVYKLEIECKPLHSETDVNGNSVHLEPYSIYVEIHVL